MVRPSGVTSSMTTGLCDQWLDLLVLPKIRLVIRPSDVTSRLTTGLTSGVTSG